MTRKVWVEITTREGGINWSTSQRDADWLASHGWSLELVEIEQEPWDTYQDYLATKHWQTTREAAVKRAGFRCQLCNGGNRTLNVHHRTYERLGRERDDDLIVLCRQCHEIFHENGKLAKAPR